MMPFDSNFSIADRAIGPSYPPYIIAEMSANHGSDIDRAYKIIAEAKKAGADAIKLQTYTADTITLDCNKEDFQINEGLWKGQTLYQLYQNAHMPWEWHKPLFKYANKIGITIFSSPFDKSAVDLLEDLNAPAYKIASFEAVDLNLIEYVASTGKPIIISTGMTNENEIMEAVEVARSAGCSKIALLKCVSSYPATASDYNLSCIPHMMNRFDTVVGLSDHTLNNTCAIASVMLGGSIIEKHFTIDRNRGADSAFSILPNEMSDLVTEAKRAWHSYGIVKYGPTKSEQQSLKHRRSLYIAKDIKAGEVLTNRNLKSVRPGHGLQTKYLKDLLGKKVIKDVSLGTPMSWDLIKR